MKKPFQLGVTIVAVGTLILGVLAATHFNSSMSAQAQKILRSNETTSTKTMAGNNTTSSSSSSNATGNMTKGNSTSVPTPVGPPGP